MRIGLNILGTILVLIGAIWALQGLNVIGGSFMTGQTQWLVIGLVCAIVGALVLALANRRRL
jgi:hypothetical protein